MGNSLCIATSGEWQTDGWPMKKSNTENNVAIFMATLWQASSINLNELINIRMHLK